MEEGDRAGVSRSDGSLRSEVRGQWMTSMETDHSAPAPGREIVDRYDGGSFIFRFICVSFEPVVMSRDRVRGGVGLGLGVSGNEATVGTPRLRGVSHVIWRF